jgi:hypothetical protein
LDEKEKYLIPCVLELMAESLDQAFDIVKVDRLVPMGGDLSDPDPGIEQEHDVDHPRMRDAERPNANRRLDLANLLGVDNEPVLLMHMLVSLEPGCQGERLEVDRAMTTK